MPTYQTLNERIGLDRSNHTLRFNRSLRDAGWSTPPRRNYNPWPHRIALMMVLPLVVLCALAVVNLFGWLLGIALLGG